MYSGSIDSSWTVTESELRLTKRVKLTKKSLASSANRLLEIEFVFFTGVRLMETIFLLQCAQNVQLTRLRPC